MAKTRFPILLCRPVLLVLLGLLAAGDANASGAIPTKGAVWENRKKLFDGYDADAPPPNMGSPAPLEVQVGMEVRSMEWDIVTGIMSMKVWFRLRWYDERLLITNGSEFFGQSYDPTGSYVPVDLSDQMDEYLWVPDIHCVNSTDWFPGLDETAASLYTPQTVPSADGIGAPYQWNIFLSRPGEITVYCRPNLADFPFDSQKCDLKFESWSFDVKYVKMIEMPNGFNGETPSVNEYTMREMVPSMAADTHYGTLSKDFSALSVLVILDRNPNYYLLNAILPMFLLVVLSALTFWIPVNPDYSGSGERLAFGATSLLTIMAVVLFTADKRPMTKESTWLDKFQSTCVGLVFVPTTETVLLFWLDGLLGDVATNTNMEKLVAQSQVTDQEASPRSEFEERELTLIHGAETQERLLAKNSPALSGLWTFYKWTGIFITSKSVDVLCRNGFPFLIFGYMVHFVNKLPGRDRVNYVHGVLYDCLESFVAGYFPVVVLMVVLTITATVRCFHMCFLCFRCHRVRNRQRSKDESEDSDFESWDPLMDISSAGASMFRYSRNQALSRFLDSRRPATNDSAPLSSRPYDGPRPYELPRPSDGPLRHVQRPRGQARQVVMEGDEDSA